VEATTNDTFPVFTLGSRIGLSSTLREVLALSEIAPTFAAPTYTSSDPHVGHVRASTEMVVTVLAFVVVRAEPFTVAMDAVDDSQPASVVDAQALDLLRTRPRSSSGILVHDSADQELVAPRDVTLLAEKQ